MGSRFCRRAPSSYGCARGTFARRPARQLAGYYACVYVQNNKIWQVEDKNQQRYRPSDMGWWQGRRLLIKTILDCELECGFNHVDCNSNLSFKISIPFGTRVRFPAGRPWSCIFRNLSRFGSYNVYLHDTRISYTYLRLLSVYQSVCLSPGYLKKYSTDFHESLWEGRP